MQEEVDISCVKECVRAWFKRQIFLSLLLFGRIYTECEVKWTWIFLPGNHIWRENVASWNNQCRRDRYLFKLAIISDGVVAMFILDSFDLELTVRSIVVLCVLTWNWNFHRNGSCYVLFVYVELTSDGIVVISSKNWRLAKSLCAWVEFTSVEIVIYLLQVSALFLPRTNVCRNRGAWNPRYVQRKYPYIGNIGMEVKLCNLIMSAFQMFHINSS